MGIIYFSGSMYEKLSIAISLEKRNLRKKEYASFLRYTYVLVMHIYSAVFKSAALIPVCQSLRLCK